MTREKEFRDELGIKINDQETMELWHIFSRVATNGKRNIERDLEFMGLKPIELRILYNLSRNGPTPMNTLSAENNVTGPWITGIVDDMEKNGYVAKNRNPSDRRVINVSILDKGQEVLEKGVVVYADLISKSLFNLTAEEKRVFREVLLKIDEAMMD